ncbi:YhdP family protein [Aurantivibrio infirmus]
MLKITRIIVKRFWGLFAFLLISLAVVVVVGRELTPKISQYKQELSQVVGEAMGVQVDVENLTGTWKGLSPELQLKGITLTNQDGAQILYAGDAIARISLLRSLFNWRVVLRNLELVQVDMNLHQDEQGVWSLVGLSTTPSTSEIDDPLDFFLLSSHIEFRDIQFKFEFRTGHQSQVNLPYLKLENSGSFHRLSSEVTIDRTQDVMSFVVEGRGDPRDRNNFSAKGHLRLHQFELDKAVAALPGELWAGLPDEEWRRGHQLDLEAWFDVNPGMEIITHGQFEVGELPVNFSETIPFPETTQTRFAARFEENGGWSVSFRDLSFSWGDKKAPLMDIGLYSDGLGKPVTVQVQEVDLQRWSGLLSDVGFLNEQLRDVVKSLNPRGSLKNLQLSIEGTALDAVSVVANMDNLAVDAWNGSPAFTGVSGYINSSPFSGFAEIDIQDGLSAWFYPVYDKPMAFDSALSQIRWVIDFDEGTVNVRSGLSTVVGEEGEINGYFSLFIPFDFGSQQEELVVQAGIRASDARYADKFIPVILPTPLLDWLDSSLGQGKVNSAGFVYRGGLTKRSAPNAVTQLFIDAEQADLNYHPDWPKAENAKGQLWLDDTNVFVNIESADFSNSKINAASLYVVKNPYGEGELLKIIGDADGAVDDGLKVLLESPIREVIGDRFDSWRSAGDLHTAVNLDIPLIFSEPGARHRVDLSLSNAMLEMTDVNLLVNDIDGQVRYDNVEGITSQNLTASLWQEKIDLEIKPRLEPIDSGVSKSNNLDVVTAIEIAVRGKAKLSAVQEWTRLAELSFLSGETDFFANLTLPFNAQNERSNDDGLSVGFTPIITIETELAGVMVDLPQPLGKSADVKQNLKITAPVGLEEVVYDIQYGTSLNGLFEIQESKLQRGAVSLGGKAVLPKDSVLDINGQLAQLEWESWQKIYQRYRNVGSQSSVLERDSSQIEKEGLNNIAQVSTVNSALTSISTRFDLAIDTISFNDFDVHEAKLAGERQSRSWRFKVDAKEIKGDLQIFDDSERSWVLGLDYLRLPERKIEAAETVEYENPLLALLQDEPKQKDFLSEIDPQSLPKMNVTIKEFSIADQNYGSWSFQMHPINGGVVVDHIIGEVRGGTILGNKSAAGATLVWNKKEGESTSQFAGRFISNDLGDVIEQWGQPKLLESEAAQFNADISWRGTPTSVAVNLLEGEIDLHISEGNFYRGTGEQGTGSALLQLFSFLNFDTWVRRLRLDFSDLAGDGMSFDSIDGKINFNNGEIQLPTPMVVEATASRFQMAGTVDLETLEMDTVVVATLPVGNNLTMLAMLAGNLPAAAGVWVISKVFAKQMNRVASVRFKVTGKLNDPVAKFERLFEDDASKTLKQAKEKSFQDASR